MHSYRYANPADPHTSFLAKVLRKMHPDPLAIVFLDFANEVTEMYKASDPRMQLVLNLWAPIQAGTTVSWLDCWMAGVGWVAGGLAGGRAGWLAGGRAG